MRSIALVALAVLLLCGATVAAWLVLTEPIDRAGRAAGHAGVGVDRPDGPLSDAEIRRCAECHADACGHFFETPHSRTLARAEGHDVFERFTGPDGAGFPVDGSLSLFRFFRHGDELWAEAGDPPVQGRVDWIFGSGSHAQTPVSLRNVPGTPVEGLELHVSWYPGVGLSRTLGHAEEIGPGVFALGKPENEPTMTACFDCHTTGLVTDDAGRPDFTSFLLGVRCDKCHEGARRHLETDGAAEMLRWSALTPRESIERCGNCHRTTDSSVNVEYAPEDPQLVRFAPIGTSRSPCFARQGELRFDCLTCHDPHRPTPTDDAFYVAKCVECHATATKPCSVQPPTSNCLPCHMPKVEVDQHLQFTDHWIRVRGDEAKSIDPAKDADHPE